MTSERARTAVGLRSERGPVLLSVMLSTALVAIDATILAAAVPAIVTDLGGFSQFPWLFSIYLLAQAVSVPVYGKLADSMGRKPVMLVGIALFLLGSVLCGVAGSMPLLIAARAVQGLGAGATLPMSMTIVGDIYTVEERARVQGFIASVWGTASIVGPTLGGVFSEYLSWRWIFFVNLPIGALAAWMLVRQFHEHIERRRHRIDYLGTVVLTAGGTLLILALLQGGHSWDWDSPVSIGLFTASALLILAFPFVERRAAEPVLPLWVFGRRILVGANLVALLVGAVLIGLTSYVPTYAQGVLGYGATLAGFALAAMTIGWPIAAATAGRLYMRIGFRDTALIGAGLIITGTLLMLTIGEGSSLWAVAGYTFVIGLGLGYTASPTLVAVQSSVGWQQRGVVTAANMFARSVGSAVGVAVFGAIANATLARRFAEPPPGAEGPLPSTADDAALALDAGSGIAPAVRDFVRQALADATHNVFIGLAVLAALVLVGLAVMPRRTVEVDS
ncbi:MAG TPA: MDR family MFS transporter [Nocardioidaceae bacterium]|nr:MDR family MFS transporter [Nocardioidaceae bacterium]